MWRSGVFVEPGFEAGYDPGRVGDRVAVGKEVLAPDIGLYAAHPHPEPAEADLLPGHRIAGLGDHGEVGREAAIQHVPAAAPVADHGPVVAGAGVGRRPARAEGDGKAAMELDSG